MLKINMEIRHGILFIRLLGNLNKITSIKIYNYIIPLVSKHKIKFIAYNLKGLNNIDKTGIKSINDSVKMVNDNNGIAYICDINSMIDSKTQNINALQVKNELSVMECLQL